MVKNNSLNKARKEKNDDFYTQLDTISKEMNHYHEYNKDVFKDKVILCPCDDPDWSQFQNYFVQLFEWYGIKKLICTSYAPKSKNVKTDVISLLETKSDKFDADKSFNRGKVYILDRDKDVNKDGKINKEDVTWEYLEGDGDFRSEEVQKYLEEADMIITNPPFSLLREFIEWVVNSGKQFSVLSNINVITNKSIFNFFKEGKIWVGDSTFNDGVYFKVDNDYIQDKKYKFLKEINGHKVIRVGSICWFTNIMFHRKDKKRNYNTMDSNIRDNKYKNLYKKYDGYDAIEIPNSKLIPSDYYGEMGVPVTFLNKLGIDSEFELLGLDDHRVEWKGSANSIDGKQIYRRLIIRRKKL